MAETKLKVTLEPDARKLDRALKGRKIGVGGGGVTSQKKQEKNSSSMLGLTKKLLGAALVVTALLSGLDFILRPLAKILTLVMTLFFLPLFPIVKDIIKFFTKVAKTAIEAPQFKIKETDSFTTKTIKSIANVGLRIGAVFFQIGKDIGQFLFDKVITPVADFITNIIFKIGDFLTKIINNIGNFISDAITKFIVNPLINIGFKLKGVFDTIIGKFREMINSLIEIVNKFNPFGKIGFVGGGVSTDKGIFSTLVKALAGGARMSVGDAIIRPNGQVIRTDPQDTLIATKNPEGLGGITININNPSVRSELDIRKIVDQVSRALAQRQGRSFSPQF